MDGFGFDCKTYDWTKWKWEKKRWGCCSAGKKQKKWMVSTLIFNPCNAGRSLPRYLQLATLLPRQGVIWVYCHIGLAVYKKKMFFLPILCDIHPFTTHRRGNLSNVAEGIVGISLIEWLRDFVVFSNPFWRFWNIFSVSRGVAETCMWA